MKNIKGITIISLVIIIIVLIILAGVSVNLLLGENGIITKSKQAKEKTEQAKLNEEIALNELYMQIEAEGGDGSNVYIEKLAEFKTAIADYIEEAGGKKTEYTADTITFGESIKGIVKEVTKLSEEEAATTDNISEGKKAWVNGELIEGTGGDSTIKKIYEYSASAPFDTNKNYSGTKFTVDVKSLYPSTYTTYNNDNFYFIVTKVYAFGDYDNANKANTYTSPTWSYNESTGILTVSELGRCINAGDDVEVKITNGYVILVE